MNKRPANRSRPRRPYTGDTIMVPRRPDYPAQPESLYQHTVRPEDRRQQRPQVRRRIWPRVRLALLGGLAATVVIMALLYWQVASLAGAIVVPEARANPPVASPLVFGANLLLVGVDERPDAPQEGIRSDTLILARLDAGAGWIGLMPIPRDTQVELPGVGITKINVAYSQGYARAGEFYGDGTTPQQGGMGLSADIVEQFLGLRERGIGGTRVDYVAQVNFDGFVGVIDALGGITVDVPRPIVDDAYPTPDFGVMRVEFQPGPQRMDGQTALIYARTRHADSDFGRSQRQQQVLRAIIAEFQAKNWFQRAALVPALTSALKGAEDSPPPVLTTLPIARPDVLLGLAWLAGTVDPDVIIQAPISPEYVAVSEVGSNLIWDAAGVRAQVDRFFTPPRAVVEEAVVQVFNGTTASGLAGRTSAELEAAGITILPAADAPAGAYPHTIVYDLHGNPRTARRIARMLAADVQNGLPPVDLATGADIVVILGEDSAAGR